jgi:hypothetical protein
MNKVAIVVLADVETHGDLGRVVNAMVAAKELKAAGDDVQLIFDGAGTQWLGLLSDSKHSSHRLFAQVRDVVSGACGFCAHAFHAEDGVAHAHVKTLDDYDGHPSIRGLVDSGYQVITF